MKMQKLEKDNIKEFLIENYKKILKDYNLEPNRILGLFVTGSANYGFATSPNEIKMVAIYLPTFEELCISIKLKDYYLTNNIRIIDIRKMYNATKAIDEMWLELLFSDPCYITPRYEKSFKNLFLKNRDEISHYSDVIRIQKLINKINDIYEQNKYTKMSAEDNFEVARMWIAAKLFLEGKNCDECYHIKDNFLTSFLWKVKTGEFKIDQEQIQEDMKEFLDKASPIINVNAETYIKQGVVTLMQASLKETIKTEEFLDYLTENELIAYQEICKRLVDRCGNISISTMIKETGLSRPVFKNVLLKMEQHEVAEIKNMGVKGTYIELF